MELRFLIARMQVFGEVTVSQRKGGADVVGSEIAIVTLCQWTRTATRVLLRLGRPTLVLNLAEFESAIKSCRAMLGSVVQISEVKIGSSQSKLGFSSMREMESIAHRAFNISEKGQTHGHSIYVDLFKDTLTISRNLSPVALYHRGWRKATGTAPLRENLVSCLIWQAVQLFGFDRLHSRVVLDPFVGSGTLLREVQDFGTLPVRFSSVSSNEFQALRVLPFPLQIEKTIGVDIDDQQLECAKVNLVNAQLHHCSLSEFSSDPTSPSRKDLKNAQIFLVGNLPYGSRVAGQKQAIQSLQQFLQDKKDIVGFMIRHKEDRLGIPVKKSTAFLNGGIEVVADYFDFRK